MTLPQSDLHCSPKFNTLKAEATLTISSIPQASMAQSAALQFPFPDIPKTGEVVEVAPGVLWTRIPLPFRLDHVNIYLIADGDGWAVLDTGIGNDATRAVWHGLLAGPLAGRTLTRLIVSHYHPDHIGLAGWLCAQFNLPLLTSQTCYLGCINISLSPGAMEAKPYHDFYLRHGLSPETTRLVTTQGHGYLRMVTPLPPTFQRLVAGDTLQLGSRRFAVLSGDGHAPEQLMLFCEKDNILLASDQVLARITPNISVWAVEPDGDPLRLYLRSLRALAAELPAGVLVLPGHQLPFIGLHARCAELAAHHHERCALIAQACRATPRSVADLVPVLFTRALDPHQLSFAFSEVHAHVNFMIARSELVWTTGGDDILRASSAGL